MALPMKAVFAALATGILVWGILDCITNFEENGCEMTWMFEYPKYLPVPLEKGVQSQYPNYGLYVYGEGAYAHQIRNLEFRGIPVLFLPGNAGSYKQVRSLGSVSLRMAEKPGTRFHFNYFVVDFSEEFSALYGALLDRQTEFVHACVKHIMRLYKSSKHPPTSVILVGHSMGGLLARALFTLPEFDPSSVHTIITQATPHQAPVVTVDRDLDMFYQKVNDYWYHQGNITLGHVVVASTGGGYRDYQVRSGLTSLTDVLPDDRAISTTTMSVPLSWVSTDHLCSVWCRQMVLTTVRALFDIVDKKTLQASADVAHRSRVFRHHFLDHNGRGLLPAEASSITLDDKIAWELRTERVWRLHEVVRKSKYIAVPLISLQGERKTDSVTVVSNITAGNWICACQIPEGEERCTQCLSLVSRTRLLPPRYSHKQFVRLSVEELGANTHLVILVPGGSKKVELAVDKYSMDTRHLVYELPGVYDSVVSFPISVTDGAAMLQIHNNTVFYSLHLAGLFSPLTAYTAVVSPRRCSHKIKPDLYEGSVLTLNVPWSHENTYSFVRYGEVGSIPIKLQTPRQAPTDDRYGFEHSEAHLEMYLHPACHYQLRLLVAPSQAFGQFVRYFGPMLPVMFVAVLLLAIGGQLTAFAKDGECLWMPDAVYMFAKPFYMVPVAMVLHYVCGMKVVARQLDKFGVPRNDMTELAARDLWLQLLPVMLCLAAWLVTILHCYMAHLGLATLSRLIALLFSWVPHSVMSVGGTVQLVIAALAAVISMSLCGTLGICITYILILVKVLRLHHLSVKIGAGKEARSVYRLYFLLALLYMWLIIISAPVLLVWVKGLRTTVQLPADPSRWSGVVAALCALPFLYSENLVLGSRMAASQLRWTLYMVAVVSIPYCLIRLYRINLTIDLALVLLAAASTLPALLTTRTEHHSKAE